MDLIEALGMLGGLFRLIELIIEAITRWKNENPKSPPKGSSASAG